MLGKIKREYERIRHAISVNLRTRLGEKIVTQKERIKMLEEALKKNSRAIESRHHIAGSVVIVSELTLQGPLKDVRLITLKQVKNDKDRTRWKEFIERYHYLDYRVSFGAH